MNNDNRPNRFLIFRYFLTIFLVAAGAVIGAVAGFYYNEKWDYLERLKLEDMSSGKFMLLNPEGYWLCSPNADDEWGGMFADKTHRKFSTDFPEAWKEIFSAKSAQIENPSGLFTSATVYPVMAKFETSSGSSHAAGDSAIDRNSAQAAGLCPKRGYGGPNRRG